MAAKKSKLNLEIGFKEMTKEEADAEMAAFFSRLENQYKDVPEETLLEGAKKIDDYLQGKIGWAELFHFTPEMLFQMAEHGYAQLQAGRLQDAERVFKVLTVLDWNNSYYHSMMGTILQRQKRYGEAIAEYSQAIELYHDDVVSLTHRGEIYLQHGLLDDARKDLERAVTLDPAKENRWAGRARILLEQMAKKKGQ
ncbi:MAG: tetratricopeptide repeat protein [Deltaproteobacteria bacterium]|nr:tetratricopeptide repeat protein [Deltaproteobacteria bacterium]